MAKLDEFVNGKS